MIGRFTVLVAAALACGGLSADTYFAKSPDGRNEIRLNTDGAFAYSVLRDGVVLVKDAPLALVTEGHGALGKSGVKAVSSETKAVHGTVPSPIYKKASVSLEGQVCTVSFGGGWKIALHARNDAVAYRFETAFGGREKVVAETADLALPSPDTTVYAAYEWGWWAQLDRFQNSWENVYQKLKVSDVGPESEHLVYLPLVVRHGGKTMCVTESDLLDYPGWNLVRKPADADRLTGAFAACPDQTKIRPEGSHRRVMGRLPYLAETDGTRTYPWRVFLLCDEPTALCEADAVWALAAPNRIKGDLGWIRPGKAAWDWWNNWNVTGVDFRAGVNTATYEHYIDFAAENKLEYVILDDGWSKRDNVMQANPDVDLPRLLKRAAEKGVGVILWCGWAQLYGQQREVFGKYAKMGVKGFKIDFMDRDDQAVERFLEETARLAAEHRLVLDFHGMHKPTGMSRTYSNVLNYEGVHGLEQVRWDSADRSSKTSYNAHIRAMKDYFPWNDLMCFYCRMSAGPMDYTPGAMRNLQASVWRAVSHRPSSQSTRVHQMALMSLYEAPLQMLCDSPTLYRRNRDCLDFMAAVPTVWDETRAVAGDMDSFAVVARRRGDVWWVSAIGGREARTVKVKLGFLSAGRWRGEVFEDGVNANRDAEDYVRRTLEVDGGDEIEIRLAPGGGGWTGRFSR